MIRQQIDLFLKQTTSEFVLDIIHSFLSRTDKSLGLSHSGVGTCQFSMNECACAAPKFEIVLTTRRNNILTPSSLPHRKH